MSVTPTRANPNPHAEVNECDPNPCGGLSRCEDRVNQFVCTCALGWTGGGAGAKCTGTTPNRNHNPNPNRNPNPNPNPNPSPSPNPSPNPNPKPEPYAPLEKTPGRPPSCVARALTLTQPCRSQSPSTTTSH